MSNEPSSPHQGDSALPSDQTPPMQQEEAERLLMGDETLDDRLETLARTSPEIQNLAAEIPRSEWEKHLGRELAIPTEFLDYTAGVLPLAAEDVAMIEDAVEKAHGVTAPFGAMLEIPSNGPAVAVLVHEEKGWFAR